MAMLERRWGRAGVAAAFATVLVIGGTAGSPATARHGDKGHDGAFTQRNLVSDIPGLADLTDPAVHNPWGIAFGPVGANATPLWVNNNFNPNSSCQDQDCIPTPEDLLTKITLYRGANGIDPISKVPLEVAASSPTGMVFNTTSDFVIDQGDGPVPARFLFNETFINADGDAPEGRITGWAPPPPGPLHFTTTSTEARKDPGGPLGLALVPGGSHRGNRLLVADGAEGTIDVYDARFQKVDATGLFVDPKAVADGLAPYNVMFLKDRVYVAYFGANGGGAVSVFKADGRFKKRLIENGPDGTLQSPWGMAIAPKNWGKFGGRLLVGNVGDDGGPGDGTINAFDRRSGKFKGTLKDASGEPLVNFGLWGIAFGNGVIGTPNSLIFAAGIGDEVQEHVYEHGLVGLIEPTGKKDADDD
jgi:uncharacterized protein (TIGR03118 family)